MIRRSLTLGLVLLAAWTGVEQAIAQTVDFPMLKGNNARTGRAGNPLSSSAGIANLRWFTPYGVDETTTIEVDNTDASDAFTQIDNGSNPLAYPGGPYDTNAYGLVTTFPVYGPQKSTYNSAAEWTPPIVTATNNYEASGPYLVARRRAAVGANPVDYTSRSPSYVYTRCIPSAVGSDPSVPLNNGQRRIFQWRVGGPTSSARQYALYVWLPTGPTRIGPGANDLLYPQRYYVYEIIYGNNQRFVEVVDTYASGGGWVRLGAGGRPTNVLFPYSGRNAIRVSLRNTMPRDDAGQLTMPNAPENYIVYADALKAVPASGGYTAGPVVSGLGTSDIRTLAANNTVTSEQVSTSGELVTRTSATVTSYNHNFNSSNLARNTRFTYSPVGNSIGEGNVDDDSTQVTFDAGWTAAAQPEYVNGSGHELVTTNVVGSLQRAIYSNTLSDGDYEVYVYLPGALTGKNFGSRIRYEVREGTTVTNIEVNQQTGGGWVRLGARRFRHRTTTSASQPVPAPLTVAVTNYSPGAGDVGRLALADAVRFRGTGSLAVSSTPVLASVILNLSGGGTGTERVAIVADESGRIHCIDANGRTDGTTDVYWTYPSLKRSDTYIDPNLAEGIDGRTPATADSVPVAEMPNGFSTSSALVQRIGGVDYLFIAATNGRVYCLEMAGRGDYDTSTRTPGTTRRVWTFPDDFPGTAKATTLGEAAGSISIGVVAGRTSVIIPTREGRVYAVDAIPTDAQDATDRTTNIRWVYPPANQAPLGPITMTPSVEFDRVYVGANQDTDAYKQLIALNINTGAPVWSFPATADLGSSDENSTRSWLSSPVTVPAATLGGGMPNTVFALNENGFLFAIDATTGAKLWSSNELGTGSNTSLTYTVLSTFDNLGSRANSPVILIPTEDGRFVAMFARTGDLNRFGTRRAWEYVAEGETVDAPIAAGNNFLYGADSLGFLYAFNNDTGSPITPGLQPGQETLVENDTRGDIFRETKVALITREAYDRLRLGSTDPNHLTYNDLIDPGTRQIQPAYRVTRSPLAFEWGETGYFVAYDFPYVVANRSNGNNVPPPIVNFSFSVQGEGNRSLPVEARQFRNPLTAPLNLVDPSLTNAGYAIIAYTLQGGGANALPPGSATLSVSISSQAIVSSQVLQNIALDPTLSRVAFSVANPLAVVMTLATPNAVPVDSPVGIGLSRSPSSPDNLINGSPDVAGTAKAEHKLLQTAGQIDHGAARVARLYIIDRSMMSLVRPDGLGLDNVRIDRAGLAWQGQGNTVYKSLTTALYPNFEDLPTRVPNNSIDYPDIRQENVRITKDPNGRTENPVFATGGVSLNAPRILDGGAERPLRQGDLPEDRVFKATVFDFEINVPKFQPPNVGRVRYNQGLIGSGGVPGDPTQLMTDSSGSLLDQGYIGNMRVFVDSLQNGSFEAGREAFRSFSISASVLAQEKMRVITPTVDPSSNESTVDLGSLPGGAGKVLNAGTYGPSSARFSPTFKNFTVLNEGNVNMLNVRLAKTFRPGGASATQPFAFESRTNDQQAWLDGSLDLWANFGVDFAPSYGGTNRQIIQKSRVTDSVPTQLVVNPSRRENAVLGVASSPLIPGLPSAEPSVSVTVPIGFPVGTYSQIVRVIENQTLTDARPESLDGINATGGRVMETFSDPSFRLIFKNRESRLTNRATTYSDPQVDNLLPANSTLAYKNIQPSILRTMGGHLALAWSSNRPQAVPTPGAPTDILVNEPWRIYFSGLGSAATFNDTTVATPGNLGYSAIRDLNFWNPSSTNEWWRGSASSTSGYPAPGSNFATLFGLPVAPDANSLRFYHPSFPASGNANPTNPGVVSTAFASTVMAFVGEARDGNGQQISRIFASEVTVNATGAVVASDPIPLPFDSNSRKGKPAVIQTGPNSAIVFYPATSGNFTGLMAANLNAAIDPLTGSRWSAPMLIPFGSTFESIAGVSGVLRNYQGNVLTPLIELVVTGKVRGVANAEGFIVRLRPSGSPLTLPALNGGMNPIAMAYPFQGRTEQLTLVSSGLYRAQGVMWNYQQPIGLSMTLNGTTTDILRASTRSVDPQTGVVSYDTNLGGKVYLEPASGKVRFSSGVPPRNGVLLLQYTPYFLRLTDGSVGYNTPSVAFDNHRTSDISWWDNGAWNDARLRNDRVVTTFVREGGAGQAPRPVVRTMRLGIRLPFNFATDDSGYPVSVLVAGNTQPFMVDPGTNSIYFTAADEGRAVTVTYSAYLPGSGQGTVTPFSTGATVGLIDESVESVVPIEQAVNESGLSMFLDPFDPNSSDVRLRRPTMLWMVWSSTRAGSPDLYLQTYAPRLAPAGSGK